MLGAIGIFAILFQFRKPATQTSTDKGTPIQETAILGAAKERGSTDKAQVVEMSGMVKTHPPSLEEKHRKVWACKKLLKEREAEGLPVSDILETGMIAPEKSLQIASQHVRKTSNIDRPPDVVLIDGFFIISYRNHENPFRAGDPDYDCRIAIDARTGEFISVEGLNRGVVGISTSRKTGAGMVDETLLAEVYKEKLLDGLKELHRRVLHGQPLESEPQPGMVDPQEAVRVAAKQVVDRNYDQSKEPWPILVDDVYIVTFWKNETDKLPDGWPTYDSRVGVDAVTGEFLAMEVTRGNRRSPAKEGEK